MIHPLSPCTQPLRPGRTIPFFLALGIFTLAALASGCASRTPAPPALTPVPMTRESTVSYAYLVFLDAFRHGNMKVAQEAITKVVELAPAPQGYLEFSEFYWRMGKVDQAREVLKKGLEAFPDDQRLTLRLSDAYLATRRPDAAATTLELYLQKASDARDMSNSVAVRLQLARVYIEMGRYAQALDTLAPIAPEDRTSMVHVLKAKANSRMGLHKKAVSLLRAALKKSPEDIALWAELAYVYELQKDYSAAEKTYSHMLELGENAPEVWLRLVTLNLKLNNPDRALALTRDGPREARFRLEAARTFIVEQFYEQAREILAPLRSMDSPPDMFHFLVALLALQADDDPATALKHLTRIPEHSELYNRVLSYKAHLLFTLNRLGEAMEAVRQGMERYPENKDFAEIQSWIFEERGQYEQAEIALTNALKKWPDDTDFLYRLALIQDRRSQRAEALETMEHIIVLDPEHADALNYVGYILADEQRDLDRALVLVRAALEQKPDSGYILDSLAWVYFHKGDLEQAWETINRAVTLQPEVDPTLWEHYGDIAAAFKRPAAARKGYRRAKAMLKAQRIQAAGPHAAAIDADLARLRGKLEQL